MNITWEIGDRVDTQSHGQGKIVNWEQANNAVPPRVQMVHTGRLGVLLDDAFKYPLYKDGIAYYQAKELVPA